MTRRIRPALLTGYGPHDISHHPRNANAMQNRDEMNRTEQRSLSTGLLVVLVTADSLLAVCNARGGER